MLDAVLDTIRLIVRDIVGSPHQRNRHGDLVHDLDSLTEDSAIDVDRNFFGEITRSQNLRYTVAWEDSKKVARVLAFDREDNVILWERRFGWPTAVGVSNDGTVCIAKNTARSTLEIIGKDGVRIKTFSVGEVIFSADISHDRQLFWAVARHPEAGRPTRRLVVIDLATVQRVLKMDFFYRNSVKSIEDSKDGLRVVSDTGVSYQFTERGALKNEGDVAFTICRAVSLHSSSANQILDRVKECLPHISQDISDEHQAIVNAALSSAERLASSDHSRAWVQRLRGEAFDKKGNHEDAVAHFERALQLKRDIGVKRRAAELKGKLRNE